jgi:hypothetical protein
VRVSEVQYETHVKKKKKKKKKKNVGAIPTTYCSIALETIASVALH